MECPVCIEEINDTIPLPCNHWVCRICIVKSGKFKCPICRHAFSMSEQEYWYIKYLIRTTTKLKDKL
jgi:hypothetical protein